MPQKASDYRVVDAAKDLGMKRQSLERLLRLGDKQFGIYIPPERQGGKGSYYVYRERVESYLKAEDIKKGCPFAQKIVDL